MAKRPPKRDDYTTTPYGTRYLALAHRNFGHKQLKDVPDNLRKYRVAPGRFFIPVSHRAFWLDDDQRQRSGPWIDALEQVEKNGNKKPLLALLKSGQEPPHDALAYLADLLERYELRKPPHRPRTPAYDLSEAEARLTLAGEFVRNYRKSGMSAQKALEMAAKDWSIDDDNKLANFHEGRRGASRRMKKRTRP